MHLLASSGRLDGFACRAHAASRPLAVASGHAFTTAPCERLGMLAPNSPLAALGGA